MKIDTNDKTTKFVIEILETLATSVIMLLVLYSTVAFPERVEGSSMEPNFESGQRIIVDRVSKHLYSLKRGDVVVLHPPGNESKDFIKRIVGMPNDIVKILDCKVYIMVDGEKYSYEEFYLGDGTCTQGGPTLREGRSFRIPEGKYMVLGDNRGKSLDSRYFGFVDASEVVGRVVFRFWPLQSAGFLDVDST